MREIVGDVCLIDLHQLKAREFSVESGRYCRYSPPGLSSGQF